MNLELQGKVALVGGASQGIGYAIARLLAAEGMCVAIAARKEAPLLAARDRIAAETGAELLAVPTDLRSSESCSAFVAAAAAKFGRIDVLVNNDGAPPLGRLDSFDDAAWAKAIDQNLMSVVRMARATLPHMRRAGGGRIVNITVNTICPGRIRTERLDKVYGKLATDAGKDISTLYSDLGREVPLKRIGTPDEIAGFVAFLCSAYGSYMTGTTTAIDGGRRAALL